MREILNGYKPFDNERRFGSILNYCCKRRKSFYNIQADRFGANTVGF